MKTKKLKNSTKAVRNGSLRSAFGEHTEAIYLSSSFIYKDCAEGEKLFAESLPYTYSRYDNPNNTMLETRLAAIESENENIGAITFSSGLAAHLAIILTFLQAGDEIISSKEIFGATHRLYDFWLRKFLINTVFVDGNNTEAFSKSISNKTKIIYVESPSNPMNIIIDIKKISKVVRDHNQKHDNKIILIVDNTFATAITQKPLELGADLVTYSATKLLDGQGRTLAGAVVGDKKYIGELRMFLRAGGLTLSPFNAWLIFKGLETLEIRVERQNQNAVKVAEFLSENPKVETVYYPFLKTHPQIKLAKSQMSSGGIIITFTVKGGKKEACKLIDKLTLFSRTSNLGDTRSTVTHPYTTTHGRLSIADKKAAGISENLIRLSIGLEDPQDLIDDLNAGLK